MVEEMRSCDARVKALRKGVSTKTTKGPPKLPETMRARSGMYLENDRNEAGSTSWPLDIDEFN